MNSKIKTDETEEVTTPGISHLVIDHETPPEPDISNLIIEDDTPVDNFHSEKQQRLLTHCLYNSWPGVDGSRRFLVSANVGVFYSTAKPPLVPDVFLSIDVIAPDDWSQKINRTYFTWKIGKVPDVVVEVVSNKVGNELGSKLKDYGGIGVEYYAVFDPLQMLGESLLQVYKLGVNGYEQMTETWLEKVQLGLTLWSGEFEGIQKVWLRWCDVEGNVIPTGTEDSQQEKQEKRLALQRAERAERAEQEKELALQESEQEKESALQRAEQAEQVAEQEKQEKESALQRAEQAEQVAEQEKQEKELALQKLAEFEARLRDLGINPN